MKSFQLHEDTGDADANKKTDELHTFLHPVFDGTNHDFEGSNSGLMLYFQVNQGDTMIIGDDGGIRVLEQGLPVVITEATFPNVFDAFVLVEMDNGAHHVNRILGPGSVDLERFEMPYNYGVDKLVEAETGLKKLRAMPNGEMAFELFITGETTEQENLIKTVSDTVPELAVAHKFVNDWFNAWDDLS